MNTLDGILLHICSLSSLCLLGYQLGPDGVLGVCMSSNTTLTISYVSSCIGPQKYHLCTGSLHVLWVSLTDDLDEVLVSCVPGAPMHNVGTLRHSVPSGCDLALGPCPLLL